MGGKTNKVKIQTYVSDEIHAYFESEALTLKVTESKLVEQILAERYGLAANLRTDSAVNPAITDRLKYLEDKLLQVIRVYEETSAYLDSRVTQLENLNAKVDESAANPKAELTESALIQEQIIKLEDSLQALNRLCKWHFEYVYKRIGLLERGELPVPQAKILEDVPPLYDSVDESFTNPADSDPATWVTLHEHSANPQTESAASLETTQGLSQRELARRLGCCVKGLMQRRDELEALLEFTRGRDSEGLGWEYRDGRYFKRDVQAPTY